MNQLTKVLCESLDRYCVNQLVDTTTSVNHLTVNTTCTPRFSLSLKHEEEVGRQHQGMDRPGVRQAPEGSGELGKMELTGCEVICGAKTTLADKR